jgi:hypothetical protein
MISIVFQTRKKYKNLNNSTSSNLYEMKYSSFESSHQDESNGSKIKSLASKYHKLIHAKYILKIGIRKVSTDAGGMILISFDWS